MDVSPPPYFSQSDPVAWAQVSDETARLLRELLSTEDTFAAGLLLIYLIDAGVGFLVEDGEFRFSVRRGWKRTGIKAVRIFTVITICTLLSNMFGVAGWLREAAYVGVSVRLGQEAIVEVYPIGSEEGGIFRDLIREVYRRHVHLALHPDEKQPRGEKEARQRKPHRQAVERDEGP